MSIGHLNEVVSHHATDQPILKSSDLAGRAAHLISDKGTVLSERQMPTAAETPQNFISASQSSDGAPITCKLSVPIVKKKSSRRKVKQRFELRGDLEAARLAVSLNVSNSWRVWLVAQEMIRMGQSQGKADNYVSLNALFETLKLYGIKYTPSNYRQLLKKGEDYFWNINQDRLYLHGRIRVGVALVEMAFEAEMPELVAWDRPGERDWYIPVNGSLLEFHANIYACWHAANRHSVISRQMLEAIWSRTRQQLQTWEQRAHIKITENYAQTSNTDDAWIPEHAVSGLGRGTHLAIIWRWQRPNTYHAPKYLREYSHKGQARKVRKAVNEICNSQQHSEKMAEAHPLGVRNFNTLKDYRDGWKRDSRNDRPDTHADYVWLGEEQIHKQGKRTGTWELMSVTREPQTAVGDYEPLACFQRVRHGEI